MRPRDCPETSVITNQRCVTSQKNENLLESFYFIHTTATTQLQLSGHRVSITTLIHITILDISQQHELRSLVVLLHRIMKNPGFKIPPENHVFCYCGFLYSSFALYWRRSMFRLRSLTYTSCLGRNKRHSTVSLQILFISSFI
jgi:hypothetical protein